MEKTFIIKWGKETINVPIKDEKNVMDLKNKIFALTGVKDKDQTLIKKGETLLNLESIKFFEDNCVITMITTGQKMPPANTQTLTEPLNTGAINKASIIDNEDDYTAQIAEIDKRCDEKIKRESSVNNQPSRAQMQPQYDYQVPLGYNYSPNVARGRDEEEQRENNVWAVCKKPLNMAMIIGTLSCLTFVIVLILIYQ